MLISLRMPHAALHNIALLAACVDSLWNQVTSDAAATGTVCLRPIVARLVNVCHS